MIFHSLTAYHKHLEKGPKVMLTCLLGEKINKKIAAPVVLASKKEKDHFIVCNHLPEFIFLCRKLFLSYAREM